MADQQPTSPAAPVQPIATIEIYDESNFKTSLQPHLTPRSLLKLTARKRGLTQIECFGFQVPRSVLAHAPAQPVINASAGSIGGDGKHEDELVFLLDDLTIMEQVTMKPKFKITMAMKYAYVDIRKEYTDEKVITILMGEMSSKFRQQAANVNQIKDDSLITLVALKVHCKNVINPGSSYIDDARAMVPHWMSNTVTDEFLESTLAQVKSLSSVSYAEAAKRFLSTVRTLFPQWFCVRFDATHAEQLGVLNLTAATEGMYISAPDKTSQPLYISYKMLSRWSFGPEDDSALSSFPSSKSVQSKTKLSDDFDRQSLHSVAESAFSTIAPSSPNKRMSLSQKSSQPDFSQYSADSPKDAKKNAKEGSKTMRFSMGRRGAPTSKLSITDFANGSGAKDKLLNRYLLALSFNQDYLYPIELVILTPYSSDMRLKELIEHFSGKYAKNDLEADDDEDILDDPSKSATPLTCVANCDYEAKGEEELMFLAGEVIQIVKKLNNGFYVGSCQNIEGVFRGTMVTFQRRDKDTNVQKRRSLLSQIATKPKLASAVIEVVHLHFIDETRKSFKVNDKMTGSQLIRQMAEKLDLSDCDFFGIAIQTEGGSERWLVGNVPVLNQGVSGNKLYFKARAFYYDSSDLTDKMMCYLYYLQVKQCVLSGIDPLNENEVIEFGSLQLQAAYGDHDADKHKPGTIGSVLQYLPIQQQKFTMSRSENWWQKKLLAAHIQHKGLTKTEAEKAYISTSQRLAHYGFTMYNSLVPENVLIGVSRDYIAIIDKTTKNFVEKFTSDTKAFNYSNSSLNVELKTTNDGVVKKYNFFSLMTPDIMEVLNIQTIAETRNMMRKICRKVRDKLNMLGMTVELDGDVADRFLKDPEYFAQYLRNGVALKILVDALDKPLPTSGPLSQPTSIMGGDSPSSELRAYSCMEKIQDFLNYARDTVGMADSDLFLPEELYNYNHTNFQTVLDCMLSFFEQPYVAAKFKAIDEYMKVNKIRGKGAAAGQPPAMTQEDFMKKVMDELMMTEVNYSKDMDLAFATWVKPLQDRIASLNLAATNPGALEFPVLQMFGNISEVSTFHQDISKRLVECGTKIEKVGEVGQVFSTRADKFIELYERYCSNHAEPADRMPDISSNPELMALMGISADPQASQLAMRNLSSQLIKPVQRIMRYHLLLKELVRYTLENHPGYGALEQGLQRMKDVASAVNEIKRRKENQRTLIELQDRIESYDGPPIQAFGTLFQDGNMIMTDKSAYNPKKITPASNKENTNHFFLFDEVIFFCKENSKKKAGAAAVSYKFKGYIPMHMVVVKDQVSDLTGDDLKFAFELTRMDTQKTFILTCTTYEEKDRWVSQINECIEKISQRPPGSTFDWKQYKSESSASVDTTASRKTTAASSGFQFTTLRGKFGGKKGNDIQEDAISESVATPVSAAHPPSGTAHVEVSVTKSNDVEQKLINDQMSLLIKQLEEARNLSDKVLQENHALNKELVAQLQATKSLQAELAQVRAKNQKYEQLLTQISSRSGDPLVIETSNKIGNQSELSAQIEEIQNLLREASVSLVNELI